MSPACATGTAVGRRPHRSRGTRVPAIALDRREQLSATSRGSRVHAPGTRGAGDQALRHAHAPACLALCAQ